MCKEFRSVRAAHRTTSLIAILVMMLSLAILTACTNDSHKCVDGDANGRCDVCGEEDKIACSGHLDTDESATCDVCGEELDTGCTGHIDTDGNGYCDFCGRDAESDDDKGDSLDGKLPTDIELPFDPFV